MTAVIDNNQSLETRYSTRVSVSAPCQMSGMWDRSVLFSYVLSPKSYFCCHCSSNLFICVCHACSIRLQISSTKLRDNIDYYRLGTLISPHWPSYSVRTPFVLLTRPSLCKLIGLMYTQCHIQYFISQTFEKANPSVQYLTNFNL